MAISVLFDCLRTLNRFLDGKSIGKNADADSPDVVALIAAMRTLKELSNVLGLFVKQPVAAGGDDGSQELLDKTIHLLIDLRKEARERKDYATGDAIRDRLGDLGVSLLDKKEGTSWELTS